MHMAMTEVSSRRAAIEQLKFMLHEVALVTGGKRARWLVIFFSSPAGVIISYRLERFFYLIVGRPWAALRVFLLPLFWVLRLASAGHEICYTAQIGRGLRVLHPTLGVVVHGDAIVGKNCVLTGGNSIGVRKPARRGELIVGDDVNVGFNACILGPVRVGNRVRIGAGAVVVKDVPDDAIAVGVPAEVIKRAG